MHLSEIKKDWGLYGYCWIIVLNYVIISIELTIQKGSVIICSLMS